MTVRHIYLDIRVWRHVNRHPDADTPLASASGSVPHRRGHNPVTKQMGLPAQPMVNIRTSEIAHERMGTGELKVSSSHTVRLTPAVETRSTSPAWLRAHEHRDDYPRTVCERAAHV
jgi:hypothetical protein